MAADAPAPAGALPDSIASPTLRRLYRYWLDKHHAETLPGRRDIDPLEIPYALGWIVLLDVIESGADFRFRLYGSKVREFTKYDWTGRRWLELESQAWREDGYARLLTAVQTGLPRCSLRRIEWEHRSYAFESLILPLAADGKTVDQLMVGMVFTAAGA